MTNKFIRKAITLIPRTIEMVEKIRQEKAIASFSAAVAYCITRVYEKDYVNKYKVTGTPAPQGESLMSEREKLKEKQRIKLEQRKIDKEIKEEAAASYCINDLEGVVVENEGIKSCKYPPNKEFPDATRTRPLSQIL